MDAQLTPLMPPSFRGPEIISSGNPHATNAALARGEVAMFGFVEEHRVLIIEILQLGAFDLFSNKSLDRLHMLGIFHDHERESIADGFGAACPADAMDVILRVVRYIEIDDVAHV